MPPQSRRLLELIERMVAEQCAAKKIERGECHFRARQVREFTGWGNSQLHVHLQRLVELEYVITHRADYGQGLVYELAYDGGGKDGRRFLPGLIDVEKLRAAHDYDDKRPGLASDHPGQNGEHPAPIRPGSGPHPGPVRGAKDNASPSENTTREAQPAQNAHLDGASAHAAA
jgi:hypothetical protein